LLLLSPRVYWPLFLLLIAWAICAPGCAHRSTRTDTASRIEQKESAFQTAETAESNTQSVATEKKQGRRQTRRWAPDGKLMEEVIEQWGSDGRVQVSADASASRSAARTDFSDVRASSSSTRASSVSWWPPWWLYVIALIVVLVVVGRVVLRRFPSLSVPGIARALVSRFARARR
jgi:hypothetical protein